MVDAVEKAGVPNMVWYNYRRVPAVTLIKQMVDAGKLGKIFHYRAKFLQDWTITPDVPQGGAATWRLDVDAAGSGVTGDLLAHCLDTAIWINGGISSLTAMTETFVKERKHAETGKMQAGRHRRRRGGADPLRQRLARHLRIDPLRPRPQGGLHARDQRREGLASPGTCTTSTASQYFDHGVEGALRGWTNILVTDGDHPYLGKWWVPGLIIGYEHCFTHQVADFLEGLQDGQAGRADLPRGARDQPRLRRDHRSRARVRAKRGSKSS